MNGPAADPHSVQLKALNNGELMPAVDWEQDQTRCQVLQHTPSAHGRKLSAMGVEWPGRVEWRAWSESKPASAYAVYNFGTIGLTTTADNRRPSTVDIDAHKG